MSNNPILPIVPNGSVPAGGDSKDADYLQTNNANLDEGETTDDQDTVEEDVREADAVNEKLDE